MLNAWLMHLWASNSQFKFTIKTYIKITIQKKQVQTYENYMHLKLQQFPHLHLIRLALVSGGWGSGAFLVNSLGPTSKILSWREKKPNIHEFHGISTCPSYIKRHVLTLQIWAAAISPPAQHFPPATAGQKPPQPRIFRWFLTATGSPGYSQIVAVAQQHTH